MGAVGGEGTTILRLASHGSQDAAPAFDAPVHSGLISSDPGDLFTGVGATGTNPSSLGIPRVEQGLLAASAHDLLSDLLDADTRSGLDHADTARLLASDEYNIFAVAKYIRQVADDGATKTPAGLPNTVASYPGIDFAAYAGNSSAWPLDNIGALGSEYTSRAWDDAVFAGWGDFVQEAYNDVIRSGVF